MAVGAVKMRNLRTVYDKGHVGRRKFAYICICLLNFLAISKELLELHVSNWYGKTATYCVCVFKSTVANMAMMRCRVL